MSIEVYRKPTPARRAVLLCQQTPADPGAIAYFPPPPDREFFTASSAIELTGCRISNKRIVRKLAQILARISSG